MFYNNYNCCRMCPSASICTGEEPPPKSSDVNRRQPDPFPRVDSDGS